MKAFTRATIIAAAAALTLSGIPHRTDAQALAEPPAGKFALGIWFQSDPGYQETPAQLNERYGFNWSAFQLSQRIPVPAYDFVTGVGGPAPVALVGGTATDADIYLTVYPNSGLDAVTDSDILSLALQIRTIQGDGRTVFLRWAPEFSGDWMVYGLQPTAFKQVWSRMYSIIKDVAPETVVVWSPNTGYSYPFGATLAQIPSAEDRLALDTNGDGQLTNADDPYSPWYPGDDQVDWIGISLYYKGPDFANINEAQPAGFFYNLIHGENPFYPQRAPTVDWYQTYCEQKPTKACMISEAGAAWHSDAALVASAPNTQVELQQAWWRDSFLNVSFLNEHPRIRAYYQFEYDKFENDGGIVDERDYRISNDTAVLQAFLADLAPIMSNYVFANSTLQPGQPAINTTVQAVTPSGPFVATTVTVDATAVISANYTQFYSGPYADISFVATNDPLAASTAVTGADGLPAATATGAPTRGIAGVAAPSQSIGGSAFGGTSAGASASTGFALGGALLAGLVSTLLR